MGNRAERRRRTRSKHKSRIKARYLSWEMTGRDGTAAYTTPLDECKKLGIFKTTRDTGTPCSCSMCGNPRRSGWTKSWHKLTIQERKAKLASEDYKDNS